MAQLPDDIEQKLLDGQWRRAVHDLMTRRRLTLDEAGTAIRLWLKERARDEDSNGKSN
jgi:hypothetical protein